MPPEEPNMIAPTPATLDATAWQPLLQFISDHLLTGAPSWAIVVELQQRGVPRALARRLVTTLEQRLIKAGALRVP